MSQRERILKHLLDFGSITPKVANDRYGITRLADVVYKLKKEGYKIDTNLTRVKNRYGEVCYVARYVYHD